MDRDERTNAAADYLTGTSGEAAATDDEQQGGQPAAAEAEVQDSDNADPEVEGAEAGEEQEEEVAAEAGEEEEEEEAEVIDDPDADTGDEEAGFTADEDLEFADHPRFIELQETEQRLNDVMAAAAEGAYGVDLESEKGIDELKLQLADSSTLYGIIDGKENTGVLLNRLGNNFGAEVARRIYDEVQAWAKENAEQLGIEIEEPAGDEGEFDDPAMKELKKLRAEVKALKAGGARQNNDATAQAVTREKKEVFDAFVGHVQKLSKRKGLDADDTQAYVDAVAKRINGNKLILNRIKAGKFVDVEKLFAAEHSRQTKKAVEAANKRVASKQLRDRRIPRTPAGGTSASSASPQRTGPRTREQRLADATSYLK